MRRMTRVFLPVLAVFLSFALFALPAQAGMLSKVKNKAKSTAHKVEDKAEDAGDAAQNKVKQADKKVGGKKMLQTGAHGTQQVGGQVGDTFNAILADPKK